MAFTIRRLAFLVAVLAGLNGAVFSQQHDPFFAETEFAVWSQQSPVEEIPWKLQLESGGLTVYQRIVGHFIIDIDGRYLKRRSAPGDVIALIQVTDGAGHIHQDHSTLYVESKAAGLKYGAYFVWHVFLLPGDYDVKLAVYDKLTRKHSFARRSLRIEPLSKDPMPDLWNDLPTIEFLKAKAKEIDSFFHPEAVGRLRLAVNPRRPVRVELLANVTGTGRAMVSHSAYNFNLGSLLPIVKTFSQMEVRGGALNIELLDLVRRQIAFQQEAARDLDWPRLKAAVTSADPTTVDVRSLRDVKHTAAFLRKEVAQRIESGAGPDDALPVLVLVSSAAFFENLDDIRDTILPATCNCAVYYIRYNPFALRFHAPAADFDNVRKVLKPLPVRTHVAGSPQDLRRIMSEIMDEISKL
jgi:hypothetical protein